MSKYNPNIHNRRSIRLKGYDYSQAGLYFITICVQNREHLFGSIQNGKMILNEAGKMIEKWYYQLENKFPDIKCGEMIVMPNHFHCVLVRGGPMCPPLTGDEHLTHTATGGHIATGGHVGPPATTCPPLGVVLQWFKTMTTNEYIRGVKNFNWKPFQGRLWQRNYYEHIIRNKQSHKNICNYILNNPAKWHKDKFHSQ